MGDKQISSSDFYGRMTLQGCVLGFAGRLRLFRDESGCVYFSLV